MERRRNFIFDCLHYAKKLSTKRTVLWKFMRESREGHSTCLLRPLWLSGKVSALGPEGFQVGNPIPLKIRLGRGLLHIKSYIVAQTSSCWCSVEVWREGTSSGVVLDI
ncbi:hypothetical protein AVEN_227260-1 [Araneus ventricosus]|uniref:Uncharacterized protein n=1 Tax=Araneus ventricosus TaxID=182803 RepID=A0A4Y2V319_ARAVE|nr:hypothetical protein AVEN_227260-1 [Araneus ventricosus]